LCVKFIEALASGKYWLAQAAARCPWHPAERRLVCIAVDSAVHLSQVGHFPPFDRSNCMQQTRARAQSATTPRRDSNTPDTSPLEHRCQTRVQVASSTSPFVRDRPVDRLATELGTLCPPPSLIGLACNPYTLALVFACVMVLGALLYSPFAWLFSSCAVRTRRAFLPVALCGLPISLAQTKRACPLPPHPLVGFFCICVFRLSLRGELSYSSSRRRLHCLTSR